MADNNTPTIAVSMSRKVNMERILGPKYRYEAAEVFVSVSGVHAGTTREQIDALLETGKTAWEAVKEKLADDVADAIDALRMAEQEAEEEIKF